MTVVEPADWALDPLLLALLGCEPADEPSDAGEFVAAGMRHAVLSGVELVDPPEVAAPGNNSPVASGCEDPGIANAAEDDAGTSALYRTALAETSAVRTVTFSVGRIVGELPPGVLFAALASGTSGLEPGSCRDRKLICTSANTPMPMSESAKIDFRSNTAVNHPPFFAGDDAAMTCGSLHLV
jgi:hypothetical protein